jgi:hypothetical protein
MFTTDPKELGERLDKVWQDQKAKNNLKAKSKRSFAISIGADASYFNRAIDGKGFSDDYITAVVKEYGVSEEWLRFGKGEMYGQGSPNVPYGTSEVQTPKTNKTLDSLAESTAKLSESNLINARNIDRLITLLEGKTNFQKADMEEIHSAKIYALEEYVLRMGQELRHSSRKTESVTLGKLEGEGFRLGEGTYTPQNESEDKKSTQHKTEKVHGSSDGS